MHVAADAVACGLHDDGSRDAASKFELIVPWPLPRLDRRHILGANRRAHALVIGVDAVHQISNS